ncbi:feather beta keratin-like [Calypte anna]|uniref:feather beta keratin-like n=1 Tax=Calypte anna TaxID=9244 RepID=UPI0011C42F4F|nr:feather beta keratin-like [Calypte anna]
MACYDRCGSCGPTPLANSCNEPCVRQCEASRVVIQPPAVQVTLPGPILTSFPQSTAVGSSASAAVGNDLSALGVPINSGYALGYGLGGLGGLGYGYGLGGSEGHGHMASYDCCTCDLSPNETIQLPQDVWMSSLKTQELQRIQLPSTPSFITHPTAQEDNCILGFIKRRNSFT